MLSSKISCPSDEIPLSEYAILPPTEMAKRETIGTRLKNARLALGLSAKKLSEKIEQDFRFEVGESTIRGIEADTTPNPGFKTIEFIALGVGLDPLQVINLGLDDPADIEPGYTDSQFALLARAYKHTRKEKKPFADELITMLIEKIRRWV